MQHLFVYGTLAPGECNAHVMDGLAGRWQPAKLRGRLEAQGWGYTHGFPGLVLDTSADWVEGLLFSSEDLSRHWSRLDEFEGAEYRRVEASVTLADGKTKTAQVYVVRGLHEGS